MSQPTPNPSTNPPKENLARKALDNPWLMLFLLFGVTLFLGLPLLWISRGFSKWGKVVVTILVLLWTVIVFACFFAILYWCYERIAGAFS